MQQHVKKQMLLHGAKPQKALQYRQIGRSWRSEEIP